MALIDYWRLLKNTTSTNLYPTGLRLAQITDVYDGDTVTVKMRTNSNWISEIKIIKVRLYGIDTPELKIKGLNNKTRKLNTPEIQEKIKQQNLAIQARDRLIQLCENCNNIIYIDCMGEISEKWGRMLGIIYPARFMCMMTRGRKSFNDILIEENLAKPYFGGKKNDDDDLPYLSGGPLPDLSDIE